MTRMNPEVKAKWIEALRSGDYTQDSDSSLLRSENGYCCLGVLCDIAEKAGVTVSQETPLYWEYGKTTPKASAYPPAEVVAWAGLEYRNPTVGSGPSDSLASLNDRGTAFERIADIIEERL